MSVVVVADTYRTVEKLIHHLRAQTTREMLELVLVVSSHEPLARAPRDWADFCSAQVVEVATVTDLPGARAAGVRRATAPVVVLTETHSFPSPGWAAALIERHQESWAAVGPVVGNANPASVLSRAGLLLKYRRWLEGTPGGAVDDLPGHNSSYKREVLLEYGPRLEAMLEAESIMHWDMRARGYRLYLEPRAVTYHLNVTRLSSYLWDQFCSSRVFANARVRGGSLSRRLLFACFAPLIPLVRFPRILTSTSRARPQVAWLMPVLPALVFGLLVSALGEMVGYAIGFSDPMRHVSVFEFERHRQIKQRMRA